MFVANWLIILITIVLIWSIWLNFARAKQISVLQYSFNDMSDFAKNSLDAIYNERVYSEGERDLVPYVITEPIEEWENKVDLLLNMQYKSGLGSHNINVGARVLGIK